MNKKKKLPPYLDLTPLNEIINDGCNIFFSGGQEYRGRINSLVDEAINLIVFRNDLIKKGYN